MSKKHTKLRRKGCTESIEIKRLLILLKEAREAALINLRIFFKMRRMLLQTLRLQGSPMEIAFQLGQKRREKIARRVEYWNRHLGRRFQGRRKLQQGLEAQFHRQAERQAPRYLEEIRAMAEGARLPFSDLFRLNLTELSSYVDKCTDLILPIQTSRGRRILLAHNEDWDPERNDVFILKAELPDQHYAVLAYDGYLPGLSAGRNSHGLCHSVNYLKPQDLRVGLPRIFVTRHLVTARNFSECLRFIRATRRAFGQAIHLAQGEKYLGLELTARHVLVRRPKLPTVHTNHYLASRTHLRLPRPPPSSRQRLKTAQSLLAEQLPEGGLDPRRARGLAREILSDRSHLPFALWREADSAEETSATLATVLLGTDSDYLEVYRNRPDRSRPTRITVAAGLSPGGRLRG